MLKDIAGRLVIPILEDDGRTTYLHALFLAPPGMPIRKALRTITKVCTQITTADPDCWGYGDIFDELEKHGFTEVAVHPWWENPS